mmetsp:Transcript_18146/g.45122  ORF Transcript_18146/g.45122 Transcript_18146/m.45122 type:complete len:80 (-) Transcript_18146:94-333(-)
MVNQQDKKKSSSTSRRHHTKRFLMHPLLAFQINERIISGFLSKRLSPRLVITFVEYVNNGIGDCRRRLPNRNFWHPPAI